MQRRRLPHPPRRPGVSATLHSITSIPLHHPIATSAITIIITSIHATQSPASRPTLYLTTSETIDAPLPAPARAPERESLLLSNAREQPRPPRQLSWTLLCRNDERVGAGHHRRRRRRSRTRKATVPMKLEMNVELGQSNRGSRATMLRPRCRRRASKGQRHLWRREHRLRPQLRPLLLHRGHHDRSAVLKAMTLQSAARSRRRTGRTTQTS